MLRVSSEHHRSLAIGLFFICLILLLFTLSVEVLFPYFNPILTNTILPSLFPSSGYLNFPLIPPNSGPYSQNFSYQDYYAAYPYLQTQNISSGNGSSAYIANNSGIYLPNSVNYPSGITPNPNIYNPYQPYQPLNVYQPTNYATTSSSTYQTVAIYPNTNNANIQSQSPLNQPGIYNQPVIAPGTYIPTGQSGYYAPPQSQTPSVYIPGYPYPVPFPQPSVYPQNQPNVYFPANPYIPNQVPVTGYYQPNANYWPNVKISEPEPPADIAGIYRGEWVSDTNGNSREIWADIDQTDAQVNGQIKLMGYVIETHGQTSFTGTVNGDTVNLDININGSTLKLEGTVQSNGDIVGTYTLEGSSESIIDEGTITLEPR